MLHGVLSFGKKGLRTRLFFTTISVLLVLVFVLALVLVLALPGSANAGYNAMNCTAIFSPYEGHYPSLIYVHVLESNQMVGYGYMNLPLIVRTMQGSLYTLGYNPKGIDGLFGPNTYNALKSYQASKNLTADGICGMYSWTSLGKNTTQIPLYNI
ncbi:MAG: peptidoglycan-binding protein [Peptococcaceae bacterium]|nr:peptidoglycan-binding protein [Peptococcaceae bacterium]